MMVPTINIGGQDQSVLNVTQLLPLPTDTPYGNLASKWVKIIARLIRLNRQVAAAYTLHAQAISNIGPQNSEFVEEHFHQLEEIAYWLKKTADELIGLSFLCEAHRRGEPLPSSIDVDCIGALLHGKHAALKTQYSAHKSYLQYLNDIANAYKHSFVNSRLNIMGKHEPVLYALTLRDNDLSGETSFVSVGLGYVVRQFDVFFQAARSYIETWPRTSGSSANDKMVVD